MGIGTRNKTNLIFGKSQMDSNSAYSFVRICLEATIVTWLPEEATIYYDGATVQTKVFPVLAKWKKRLVCGLSNCGIQNKGTPYT